MKHERRRLVLVQPQATLLVSIRCCIGIVISLDFQAEAGIHEHPYSVRMESLTRIQIRFDYPMQCRFHHLLDALSVCVFASIKMKHHKVSEHGVPLSDKIDLLYRRHCAKTQKLSLQGGLFSENSCDRIPVPPCPPASNGIPNPLAGRAPLMSCVARQ